jgi:cellobiose-specific phosphotransferase system component IIC
MRRQIIGRLIGLAVIEFVIGVSWLFGVNRMLVMVAVIGCLYWPSRLLCP